MSNKKKAGVQIRKLDGRREVVFTDGQEADEVEQELTQLLAEVNEGRVAENAELIVSVGQNLHGYAFAAKRLGGTWRTVSDLARRINQFEGHAQICLAVAQNALDLEVALAIKVLKTSGRLDTILKTVRTGNFSPETRELIEKYIEGSRERTSAVGEEVAGRYLGVSTNRMLGDGRG